MKKHPCILILANSNCQQNAIFEILECANKDIVLVTTHRLSELSLVKLKSSSSQKFIYFTIIDILSEHEMVDIDAQSVEYCKMRNVKSIHKSISFCSALAHIRSCVLIEKLQKKYLIDQIFAIDGLGYCTNSILKMGLGYSLLPITSMENNSEVVQDNKSKIWSLPIPYRVYLQMQLLKRYFRNPPITVVLTRSQRFFFETRSYERVSKFFAKTEVISILRLNKLGIRYLLLRVFGFLQYKKNLSCASIHNPVGVFQAHDLYVFQDGFLPSNYTESYLCDYPTNSVFCPSDPFAARWFNASKRQTAFFPCFYRSFESQFPFRIVSKLSTILVVLNHAGDWSSLINRSDTHDLILCLIKGSSSHPEILFNVRPHPTMTHPSHEGLHSLDLLYKIVGETSQSNIVFSSSALHDDLASTDLVITEYSDVFFDALNLGIPTLIYKPQYRRSYMEDLVSLGFPFFETAVTLSSQLSNPSKEIILKCQNARANYRKIMISWCTNKL